MEPISTAIVTAVATGLAKDAVKAGYEKVKKLLFGADGEKKPELEQAIATVEKAHADLQRLITASHAATHADVLKEAAELMKQVGDQLSITGNQNATAIHGKAVVVTGNAGNITL